MSLKKIAEMTGTSIATVSRVLNHPEHRCNKDGLNKKIWDAAAALQYTPNGAARHLRLGSNNTQTPFMVDILLTRFDSLEDDAFFLELFQYLQSDLLQSGCVFGELLHSVDILNLGRENTGSIPYKFISKTGKQNEVPPSIFITPKENTGLIILGKCPAGLIPLLKKRYPYITGIDRNPTDYEYDEVICNGTTAAEKAVEYLISLGHKEIAYIGDCTYESRYTGYYQTLLNHKLPLNHRHIHPTSQTREEGYHVMHSIIQSPERPTAIFCANDCTALGVLDALKKHKKKGYLPSIISIDNISSSQKTSPMLTTIDIPKREMSHLALTLLLDRKNKQHKENVRLELPCRLIERESCSFLYE